MTSLIIPFALLHACWLRPPVFIMHESLACCIPWGKVDHPQQGPQSTVLPALDLVAAS
jgi:hypothetical protein